MKLIVKDIIKISFLFLIWNYIMSYQNDKDTFQKLSNLDKITQEKFFDMLSILPYFTVILVLYYAVMKISYNILFINDCEKEYDELITELKLEEISLKKRLTK